MKSFLFILSSILLMQSANITRDELLGRFDPALHPDFTRIASRYTDKPEIFLRSKAYDAFEKMYTAAKEDGVKLRIISATRNFDYQRSIWERKWERPRYMGWQNIEKARDIMTYSSMPGTSRHHWGTDIDLNSLSNDYFSSGKGKAEYDWLEANAPSFGFEQTYTSKSSGRTGYEEEKWHWSYKPLSEKYLEAYLEMIRAHDITGFSGSEVADSLNVIRHYVNGVE